jgi:hypothetical protein
LVFEYETRIAPSPLRIASNSLPLPNCLIALAAKAKPTRETYQNADGLVDSPNGPL